jgi:hypothetical protein
MRLIVLLAVTTTTIMAACVQPRDHPPSGAETTDGAHGLSSDCPDHPLRERARSEGRLRLLVTLDLEVRPSSELDTAAARQQRERIAAAADQLLASVPASQVRLLRRYAELPLLAVEADEAGVCSILRAPGLRDLAEDRARPTGG